MADNDKYEIVPAQTQLLVPEIDTTKISAAVNFIAVQYNELNVNITEKMEKTEKEVEKKTSSLAKHIGEGFKAVKEMAVGWGGNIVDATGKAVTMAGDLQRATDIFSISAGIGKEDLGSYQQALEQVYQNNYGSSFDEIANSMTKLSQQGVSDMVGDMDELQRAVEYGFLLKDTYGIDVEKGIEETANMMKQFGVSADEAYGLMAQGAAQGLYDNGEFGAATAALSETWDGTGANAQEALAKMQEGLGGTTDVLSALTEQKDGDLGSMFEELSRSVDTLLLPLGEELIPILSSMVQEVLPVVQGGIEPLIGLFAQFAEQIAPIAKELFPVLTGALEEMIPPLAALAEELLDQLLGLFVQIAPILGELIAGILPVLVGILEAILPPLMDIIAAILPPLLEAILLLLPAFQAIIDVLAPLIELIVSLALPIVELIMMALSPLAEALTSLMEYLLVPLIAVFEEWREAFAYSVEDMIAVGIALKEKLLGALQGILSFIGDIFAGNWEAVWSKVCGIFQSLIGGLGEIAKKPINFIIDMINKVIEGLNSFRLPDWFPIGAGASLDLRLIPRLKSGIDFVGKDLMPAFLDYGERVLTQNQNARFNALGGLDGMEYALAVNSRVPEESKVVLGKGCIVVESTIDGRKIGQTMAPYIDMELGEMEARKARG